MTTLVVVKMLDYSAPSIVEILWTIAYDIERRGRSGVSVVSISWGSSKPWSTIESSQDGRAWLEVQAAMVRLTAMNVQIICAAGNFATTRDDTGEFRRRVDTVPAFFGLGADNRLVAIAVGNSDNNGNRFATSQQAIWEQDVDLPQIYAPGVRIMCAGTHRSSSVAQNSGTSICKPIAVDPHIDVDGI